MIQPHKSLIKKIHWILRICENSHDYPSCNYIVSIKQRKICKNKTYYSCKIKKNIQI